MDVLDEIKAISAHQGLGFGLSLAIHEEVFLSIFVVVSKLFVAEYHREASDHVEIGRHP